MVKQTEFSVLMVSIGHEAFANTVESGYYDISTDREKSVVKSELSRYSGVGVFCSHKVFSGQFKDLTGITSVPK